jgi:hypothetical protein
MLARVADEEAAISPQMSGRYGGWQMVQAVYHYRKADATICPEYIGQAVEVHSAVRCRPYAPDVIYPLEHSWYHFLRHSRRTEANTATAAITLNKGCCFLHVQGTELRSISHYFPGQ